MPRTRLAPRRGAKRQRAPRTAFSDRRRPLGYQLLESRRLLDGECSYTVSITDDEFDGNFDPGDLSLREAIDLGNASAAPVTVCVPTGVYRITIPPSGEDYLHSNVAGDFNLYGNVSIVGAGPAETILDAQRLDRVLMIYNSPYRATIQGLTVRGGFADTGGGIYIGEDAEATLVDVVVTDNIALGETPSGGGISINEGRSVELRNVVVSDNQGELGGGIGLHQSYDVKLIDSVVQNNQAASGGGLFLRRGNAEIQNTTVAGNRATDSGGGLAFDFSTNITLDGVEVRNNAAQYGGGLAVIRDTATVRLIGSNLHDNTARYSGGAIDNEGSLAIEDSTLRGNSATGVGGALANSGAAATIDRSLLEDNWAGTPQGQLPGDPHTSYARGGAIYNRAATGDAAVTIRASTLRNNTARAEADLLVDARGGAIFNAAGRDRLARVEILDSTLAGNVAEARGFQGADPQRAYAAGGALYSEASDTGTTLVTVQRSELLDNRATTLQGAEGDAEGGAVHNRALDYGSRASLSIVQSTLARNQALATHPFFGPLATLGEPEPSPFKNARGGGVYNGAGPVALPEVVPIAELSILDSTLADNVAFSESGLNNLAQGGAVWNDSIDPQAAGGQARASIVSSTLSGNRADTYNDDCTFAYGGGIYNGHGLRAAGPRLTLLHSTVVDNAAISGGSTITVAEGGGVSTWNTAPGAAPGAEVGHTIVAGNTTFGRDTAPPRPDVSGDFLSRGHNLIGVIEGSGGFGAAGDLVGSLASPLDPRLAPLGNYGGPTLTHLPLAGSPVIDAGSPDFNPDDFTPPLSTDQRGQSRVVSSPILDRLPILDIGAVELQHAQVVGRQVFYNNSLVDGNDPTANAFDDFAIATDKSALLPGQTASFAHYTSYSRGLNGLMIDVAELPGLPSAADFTFRVGNNNSPGSWPAAPPPSSVSVRSIAGGLSRITLIWPDGAVKKQWLQVTLLPAVTNGLGAEDVFYFGNAVGETGNSTEQAVVNAADELRIRVHSRTPLDPAPITDPFDINRDQLVNASDQILARVNSTNPLTALRLLAVPAESAGGAAAADAALAGLADEPASSDSSSRRRRRS